MKRAAIFLLQPAARPFTIMIGAILVLALMDRGGSSGERFVRLPHLTCDVRGNGFRYIGFRR